uniref:alpha/beta hydrolase n=1 Tax=Leucobacter sp. BZR 635 TaxID=3378705 RepID=UPI003A851BB7
MRCRYRAVVSISPKRSRWIEEAIASSESFGAACSENTGELLAHVDTVSTVRDLDMLRQIVGDPQLNYLGYSYGTHIGARYAEMFPEQAGRLVLDGVLDPTASEADVIREQTRGFELALRSFVTACLETRDCPLSGSVDFAMGKISDLLDEVDRAALEASDGRVLTTSTMLTAIVTPLYAESNWGYLNQLFASVAEGDADVAFALADSYYGRMDGQYLDNSTEAFQAINCLDYPNEVDPERMREQAAELERIAPTIGRFQGFGDVSCAGWPHKGPEERAPVRAAGAAPILVVGTTGDPATPYRWAESLAEQLESGVLVRFEGEGHTAYGQNACVNDVVESYLIDGTVPASGVTCR